MQTLLVVLADLLQFASEKLFGMKTLTSPDHAFLTNGMQENLLQQHPRDTETKRLPTFTLSHTETAGAKGTLYFIGEDVALHTDPVMAFDVISEIIPYGTQVHLLKLGGRWAFIRSQGKEGWILKDVLREQVRDVLPDFHDTQVYEADNSETVKLRNAIHDEFCGGKASLPLTDAEYVTYKLYEKGFSIPWSKERPRTPGTWQKKLRGKTGVHIGITPKTSSIMEYIVDDIGYVAFVEAVYPDSSIKQSAVGVTSEGVYSESLMNQEQWRELRPVFISVH